MTDPKSHSSKVASQSLYETEAYEGSSSLPQSRIMGCIWKLFKWPKRQKSEGEERLPLETFDRITLLQSLEGPQSGECRDDRKTNGLQERYVRFGIGGAGNKRK
ncbi:uncharacterized protein N7515_007964 [Penicillium bovifimosum]|uniref:Uncharacterized protein n=1 Tax=Penicillium bovifimosum TaxID=126998 RepID=A0A9W9GMI5_9EURO|nr:uncharacterized protein N7515_007964 [Penicillium bovifimosum]KAJ5124139.1 hypothetical protein N7515_007964 [Penicillium bovifimosum]